MAVTVSGTSITFNDATVQTTAGGAVNTTTVLAATAGASAGAVGTYAFAGSNVWAPLTASFGGTVAGSSLSQAGVVLDAGGTSASGWQSGKAGTFQYGAAKGIGTLAGTWRCMGAASNITQDYHPATLWLRIS